MCGVHSLMLSCREDGTSNRALGRKWANCWRCEFSGGTKNGNFFYDFSLRKTLQPHMEILCCCIPPYSKNYFLVGQTIRKTQVMPVLCPCSIVHHPWYSFCIHEVLQEVLHFVAVLVVWSSSRISRRANLSLIGFFS